MKQTKTKPLLSKKDKELYKMEQEAIEMAFQKGIAEGKRKTLAEVEKIIDKCSHSEDSMYDASGYVKDGDRWLFIKELKSSLSELGK